MPKNNEIKKIISALDDLKAAFESLKKKLSGPEGKENKKYYRIVFKHEEEIKSFLDDIKNLQK